MKDKSIAFFKTPAPQAVKKGPSYECINVGGEQFHAAAVVLIEHLQNAQVSEATLKKILDCFYLHFPNNELPRLKQHERMTILLHNFRNRMSELVECMAYALQQLTADELSDDHLNLDYREVFASLPAGTPKSHLYDPHTELPTNALRALSRVLDLPLTLSFKEPGKELRKREVTMNNGQPTRVIQIQDGEYYPGVNPDHKEKFAYVGQLAVTARPVGANKHEGTLAEILAEIAADNQDILHSYEKARNTILSMFKADEISYEQLRDDIYIKLIPLQSTNESFIKQLREAEHPVIARDPANSILRQTELLADNLASWIAEGLITSEQLFDLLEPIKPEYTRPS